MTSFITSSYPTMKLYNHLKSLCNKNLTYLNINAGVIYEEIGEEKPLALLSSTISKYVILRRQTLEGAKSENETLLTACKMCHMGLLIWKSILLSILFYKDRGRFRG